MCLNIRTPTNHHFPFGTNENVVVSAVPILKHFRVVEFANSIDQDEFVNLKPPHLDFLYCFSL